MDWMHTAARRQLVNPRRMSAPLALRHTTSAAHCTAPQRRMAAYRRHAAWMTTAALRHTRNPRRTIRPRQIAWSSDKSIIPRATFLSRMFRSQAISPHESDCLPNSFIDYVAERYGAAYTANGHVLKTLGQLSADIEAKAAEGATALHSKRTWRR